MTDIAQDDLIHHFNESDLQYLIDLINFRRTK